MIAKRRRDCAPPVRATPAAFSILRLSEAPSEECRGFLLRRIPERRRKPKLCICQETFVNIWYSTISNNYHQSPYTAKLIPLKRTVAPSYESRPDRFDGFPTDKRQYPILSAKIMEVGAVKHPIRFFEVLRSPVIDDESGDNPHIIHA